MKQAPVGWVLLLLASGCTQGHRATLSDADQVRLAAVVDATARWPTAAVCLAVDPRIISGAATTSDAFDQAQDPVGPFSLAVAHTGHVYPQSKCSQGQSAEGFAPIHPEGSARRGVFVTVGAVGLSRDQTKANVQVITWPGELQTQIELLRYRKLATEWQLEHRNVTMQE